MRAHVVAALAVCWGAGCAAGIDAREVAPGSDAPGLRYYLPTPLLVVRQLDDGRWTGDLELVVDRRREFTVQPWAVLASSRAAVDFAADGTLRRFQLEQDDTEVPGAIVDALKDLKVKEQALREQQLRDRERRVKSGAARMADVLSGPAPGEQRAVYAAVVRGAALEDWQGRPLATVALPPKARAGRAASGAGAGPAADALSAEVTGDRLVIAVVDTPLAAPDAARLRLWTAADEITDASVLDRLRGALRVVDGRLEGPAALFRAAGVRRVGFGDALQARVRAGR